MCNSERAELCRRQLQELLENQPKTAQARERVREAMNAYIDHSPIDKLDVSLIEAAADWLAETDPDFPEFDLEGGLAKLLQSMPAQPAPARKHVRLRRIAAILAAVIAAFMIVANALNLNPIQSLLDAAETIRFRLTPSGEMTLPPSETEEYPSLQAALDAHEIDVALPRWIPVGFDFMGVYESGEDLNHPMIIGLYSNGSSDFYIQVEANISQDRTLEFEKDGTVKPYPENGETYWIIENTNNVRAFWYDGTNVISIRGALSIEQLKTIIQSIP